MDQYIYKIDERRSIEIRLNKDGEIPDGWEELPEGVDPLGCVVVINSMPVNIDPVIVELRNELPAPRI